jgi:glycosyltransferase involved in cell wall biosynthesis
MNRNSPIKVLFISTSYPNDRGDWKGRFIERILFSLCSQPNITVNYWGPPGPLPLNASYVATNKESEWLLTLLNRGGIAHLLKNKPIPGILASIKLLKLLRGVYKRHNDIDLFHVNWLQNAIPLWGIKQPTLTTVLGTDYRMIKNPLMAAMLRNIYKQRPSAIIPNAEWMSPLLSKSFGDLATVKAVPFGVDSELFKIPIDNTSQTIRKWIVVSRLTKAKVGLLFKWTKEISLNNEFHLIGPNQENLIIPEWIRYHGPDNPEHIRKVHFKNASGLITLSQHDEGRPQILLEAMAAGLPVIVSDIPAHKDFITSGKNGLIVKNYREFVEALNWLSNNENASTLALSGREWIRSNIGTWDDCVERFLSIYEELIQNDQNEPPNG